MKVIPSVSEGTGRGGRHSERAARPPSSLATLGMTVAAFAILALAESKRPLRRRVAPKGKRVANNFAMGAAAAAANALVARNLVQAPRRRSGVATRIAGVLLLDYSLWWWHRWNHRIPLLWTFHREHHLDSDLDVSTGIRFAPGEMALSAFFRAAQIEFLGVDEATVALWQRLLLVSILFHHSNVRLPERVDRALATIVVTPRMHGIHHSDRMEDTDSNFASLFTVWDWMHGTMRLDRPQEALTIGAPASEPPR